jgi:hypothetical protein
LTHIAWEIEQLSKTAMSKEHWKEGLNKLRRRLVPWLRNLKNEDSLFAKVLRESESHHQVIVSASQQSASSSKTKEKLALKQSRKRMEENMVLLKEIEQLRVSKKFLEDKLAHLQSVMVEERSSSSSSSSSSVSSLQLSPLRDAGSLSLDPPSLSEGSFDSRKRRKGKSMSRLTKRSAKGSMYMQQAVLMSTSSLLTSKSSSLPSLQPPMGTVELAKLSRERKQNEFELKRDGRPVQDRWNQQGYLRKRMEEADKLFASSSPHYLHFSPHAQNERQEYQEQEEEHQEEAFLAQPSVSVTSSTGEKITLVYPERSLSPRSQASDDDSLVPVDILYEPPSSQSNARKEEEEESRSSSRSRHTTHVPTARRQEN